MQKPLFFLCVNLPISLANIQSLNLVKKSALPSKQRMPLINGSGNKTGFTILFKLLKSTHIRFDHGDCDTYCNLCVHHFRVFLVDN